MPSSSASTTKAAAADEAIKKFREVSAANLSVLAKGNKSRLQKYLGVQQEHPKNFAWLADNAPVVSNDENENPNNSEPRFSEYKENFINWPLTDANTAVPQPSKWSPNSLFPNEIDASKWASEHQTMFADVTKGDLEQGEVAGIKTKTALRAPTFFAWKKFESVPAPIESAPAPIEVNNEVEPEPVETVDSIAPVEEIEAPLPITKKVEESPLASYEDAIDASKWKSEYNTKFLSSEAECEAATAGVATKSEIGHPSNFAWDANSSSADQQLPPPPPADSIFKHVTFDPNPISEYAENFQKRSVSIPVEKSYSSNEASAPIPVYSDHIDASKWRSEYSSKFSSKEKSESAPEPIIIESEVGSNEVAVENDFVTESGNDNIDSYPVGEKVIDDHYVTADSSDIPTESEEPLQQSEVIIPSVKSTPISTGRSNMENVLYFPKTEIEVASQTSTEPSKSRKLWFTSEQRDQYQWPTAATLPLKNKISSITSKENIFAICQNLDGSDLVKSKSSLTIGPKMTTESRSKFAWPDPTLVIKRDIVKAPKSQMSLGADPVIDNTSSSTISADSIVPIIQEVVTPAPPVPVVSRQREFVEEKAASEINTVSAPPRKTTSLQLQDSAAAMRIAKSTGLRLDEQRIVNRPHSAPIRRTSSLVADQIIAQQTKKGSADAFNPILMHKRFPMSSDKQIGRWRTETKSSFVWSKKKST